MNAKFYALPPEKRERIIRAGYRVFGEKGYGKAPAGEIAREAGISKSLLFYYFKNKKELYLFLWDQAVRDSETLIDAEELFGKKEFFEILELSMKRKLKLMEKYPGLSAFCLRAYEEQHEEVAGEIRERVEKLLKQYGSPILEAADPEKFLPGLDLEMMYREIYWASDGYIRSLGQNGAFRAKEAEEGFQRLVDFWKSVYLRRK